ncbi:aldehyde dehydrogenase family protein [Jiulongibacter sp. NS-SX5]|uniref:aldehyde dehydrogenase family protein n=1 Tax=Jiulongibacter sp. NS-SX5 TaxID=3463854 RepID=UPI0040591ECE
MTNDTLASVELSTYKDVFEKQLKKSLELRVSTARDRIQKIKSIKKWTEQNADSITAAVHADFRKSEAEVNISEILPVISEAKNIIKNLSSWIRPKSVSVPLLFLGTSNKKTYQPKGCSLIISPWNYPFILALKPVMTAIAAGCTVVLKPSELTPNTSFLLQRMMEELFDENEVKVFTGDAETAIALQKLPFNHVFFTGSPAVGKLVMKAASQHLASVTLELGGKSPVIVRKGVNMKSAAKKVAWGKFLNAGQTCIAPDYLLIQEDLKDEFIEALKAALKKMAEGDFKSNSDYCRIINQKHFERINGLVEKSVEMGAEIAMTENPDKEDCFLAPTILTEVTKDMPLMQEEIFGPILPVLTYNSIQEAIDIINEGEKPLAMYIFGGSSAENKALESQTSSGPIVYNDFAIQFVYHGLPFGGINNSGTGVSGGFEGFMEFTHMKPVIKNHFNPSSMFYPPYTGRIKKMLDIATKYLT